MHGDSGSFSNLQRVPPVQTRNVLGSSSGRDGTDILNGKTSGSIGITTGGTSIQAKRVFIDNVTDGILGADKLM